MGWVFVWHIELLIQIPILFESSIVVYSQGNAKENNLCLFLQISLSTNLVTKNSL